VIQPVFWDCIYKLIAAAAVVTITLIRPRNNGDTRGMSAEILDMFTAMKK